MNLEHNNKCKNCNTSYFHSEAEKEHVKKFSAKFEIDKLNLSFSKLCPSCRLQTRFAFRNELKLYSRKCDYSDKSIISIYPPNSEFKVFHQDVWWSDKYDSASYAKDYDFSKTFFEQFEELRIQVPKLALINSKSVNSDYTNYSRENKNCYMSAGTGFSEDCYYSSRIRSSKSICDSYDLDRCELCYECCFSSQLYDCSYSTNCHNSNNLLFCDNCRNCKNCIGCVGLSNLKFCVFNKQLSESDYNSFLSKYKNNIVLGLTDFENFRLSNPYNKKTIINCEDSSGDQLNNCKSCVESFSCKNCQDCSHIAFCGSLTDCVDCSFSDKSELAYNCANIGSCYDIMFSVICWHCNSCAYVDSCYNSKNLFGCTGVKKGEYQILNKKYSADNYNSMIKKIILHMKETGEWGEFFPIRNSPFPYNSTVAQDYFPIEVKDAEKMQLKWKEDEASKGKLTENENINVCSISKKNFRIVPKELEFYKRMNMQTPVKCPEVRLQERMDNIRKLLSNV